MYTRSRIQIVARPRGRSRRTRGDPDASQGPGRRWWLGCLAVACAAMLGSLAGPALAQDGTALKALEISHAREQNARAHYLAFAAAARREGQYGVEWLFRVAATAESIHAARSAAMIEPLGGRLIWTLESVVVGRAEDNLRAAIDMEKYERQHVYPRFAAYAREECLYEVAAAFAYARTAEGTHAARFAEALEAIQRPTPPPAIASLAPEAGASIRLPTLVPTLYLCTGDGSVFTSRATKSCPNCGAGASWMRTLTAPAPANWATGENAGRQIASTRDP